MNRDHKLASAQKKKYMQIVYCLWQHGANRANEIYPQISTEQFQIANQYYNSLRCVGCMCGSCVNLPELASNLDKSPKELKPIAQLAQELGSKVVE